MLIQKIATEALLTLLYRWLSLHRWAAGALHCAAMIRGARLLREILGSQLYSHLYSKFNSELTFEEISSWRQRVGKDPVLQPQECLNCTRFRTPFLSRYRDNKQTTKSEYIDYHSYSLSHLQCHFRKLFPRLEPKAHRSFSTHTWLKRRTSFRFELWKELSKMALQTG